MYRDSAFYDAFMLRLGNFCMELAMTPGGFVP
jgi:hypothetical protein